MGYFGGLSLHTTKNFYIHTPHTRTGKHEQRLLADNKSIKNQDTQSHQTDVIYINQCLAQTLSGVQTHVLVANTQIFRYSQTRLHSSTLSPLICAVVKTTAFSVFRKAIIMATMPVTENQNEVPDGKAFLSCPLCGTTVIIPVYILVIRRFALAIFFRMTVLNLSLWQLLILFSQKKQSL